MPKWADYGVCGVHYSADPKNIAEIKVLKDNGESFGTEVRWSKEKAVAELDALTVLMTIFLVDGKWKQGAKVRRVHHNGRWFLRTDANDTPEDNLGELPRY